METLSATASITAATYITECLNDSRQKVEELNKKTNNYFAYQFKGASEVRNHLKQNRNLNEKVKNKKGVGAPLLRTILLMYKATMTQGCLKRHEGYVKKLQDVMPKCEIFFDCENSTLSNEQIKKLFTKAIQDDNIALVRLAQILIDYREVQFEIDKKEVFNRLLTSTNKAEESFEKATETESKELIGVLAKSWASLHPLLHPTSILTLLGNFYYRGIGTEQNTEQAFQCYATAFEIGRAVDCHVEPAKKVAPRMTFFRTAAHKLIGDEEVEKLIRYAKAGNSFAQVRLAHLLLKDKSHRFDKYKDEILNYLKKGEEMDNPAMIHLLGDLYNRGMGFEKNTNMSIQCYQRAAGLGYPNSIYSLALCHHQGLGTEKDEKKAFAYYKQAADLGHSEATLNLAVCYAIGIGTNKDQKEAIENYKKALSLGDPEGGYKLALSYRYGFGVKENHKEAIVWLNRAATLDHSKAISALAFCYREGIGVDKDAKKAVEWLFKAVELNQSNAVCCLGHSYSEGFGVDKNYSTAFACYEVALAMGYKEALLNLGHCYEEGKGVERNLDYAKQYYEVAKKNNVAKADLALQNLMQKISKQNARVVSTYSES